MQPPDTDRLEQFLAERGGPLLRAAKLLTGSQEAAEDLLQAALERLLRHWSKIDGDPEGYLRRTLYNLAADGWRRRQTSAAGLRRLRADETGGGPAGAELVDLRDALVRLMLALELRPAKQGPLMAVFWVDPSTYLPVRDQVTAGRYTIRDDYRWLPPTQANLATLNLRIPSGFTQIPPQDR